MDLNELIYSLEPHSDAFCFNETEFSYIESGLLRCRNAN